MLIIKIVHTQAVNYNSADKGVIKIVLTKVVKCTGVYKKWTTAGLHRKEVHCNGKSFK